MFLKDSRSNHSRNLFAGIWVLVILIGFSGCRDIPQSVNSEKSTATQNSSTSFKSSLGTITQITTSARAIRVTDVDGDYVVWEDDRNGNSDIYLYDVKKDEVIPIASSSNHERNPAISGDYVVWRKDEDSGSTNIYLYQISTGVTKQISTGTSDELYPAISGDYVAWTQLHDFTYQIFIYQISTGDITQITDTFGFKFDTEMHGDRIVWKDLRNGTTSDQNYDIYMYEISSGALTRITDNTAEQRQPNVYENYIAWKDKRNGHSGDIYLYDTSTGDETPLSVSSSYQSPPRIFEDHMVYSSSGIVYLHNIPDDERLEISPGNHPSISEKYIAFLKRDYQMYLLELGASSDTTPPELAYTTQNTTLWPPNHKMHVVVSDIQATDNEDENPQIDIQVTSNEHENGTGDGNSKPDWQVEQQSDGTYHILVRAERKGNGNDRIYSIDLSATDASDNTTSETITVTVGHDKS